MIHIIDQSTAGINRCPGLHTQTLMLPAYSCMPTLNLTSEIGKQRQVDWRWAVACEHPPEHRPGAGRTV
jgi:hypothetical protein